MERERLIEILIALILIVLILILVFLGLSLDKPQVTSSVVSNSYNNIENSYNTVNNHQKTPYENKETIRIAEKPAPKTTHITKPAQKTYYKEKDQKYYSYDGNNKYYSYSDGENKGYYHYNNYQPKKDYVWDWNEWDKRSYSKDYDSFGKHSLDKSWGFYTDTYKVYIYNDGPGDYFKVDFYFEDCWGHEKNYEMRKYAGHEDENIFYLRDINSESDKYCDWRYVVSH